MTGKLFDSAEDYGTPVPRMNASCEIATTLGTGLDAGSIVIDESLSRLSVAACLLTGSARQSERMRESSQQLDGGTIPDGCPSWKAIALALLWRNPDSKETSEEARSMIPIELQGILRLPPRLRQCFVLRVLMAMPLQYCAGLLQIDAQELDANCMAAQKLAGAGEVAD